MRLIRVILDQYRCLICSVCSGITISKQDYHVKNRPLACTRQYPTSTLSLSTWSLLLRAVRFSHPFYIVVLMCLRPHKETSTTHLYGDVRCTLLNDTKIPKHMNIFSLQHHIDEKRRRFIMTASMVPWLIISTTDGTHSRLYNKFRIDSARR